MCAASLPLKDSWLGWKSFCSFGTRAPVGGRGGRGVFIECIRLGHPHRTSSSLISMKGFGITSGQMGSGLWEERVGGAPLLLQTPLGNWQ